MKDFYIINVAVKTFSITWITSIFIAFIRAVVVAITHLIRADTSDIIMGTTGNIGEVTGRIG